MIRNRKYLYRLAMAILILLTTQLRAWSQGEPPYITLLQGDSIYVGNSIALQDTVFYDVLLKPTIEKTLSVYNIISLRINEFDTKVIPDSFQVHVKVRIYYADSANAQDSIDEKTLTVTYNKFSTYEGKAILRLRGAHWVQVKVLEVTADYATLSSVLPVVELENRMVINRDFYMDEEDDAITTISKDTTTLAECQELKVYWTPSQVAEMYDLEWTFIDSSAINAGWYNTGGVKDPAKIFRNNASRVRISSDQYLIPLLYDGKGALYFRVRAVQEKENGEILYTVWSDLGDHRFTGHETNLNWQATTTFAEEGKRKSVVQYFDGSLRGRQTVTRDNTTKTTLVAETLYDKQGRPVIQVLPAPTLSQLIAYTPLFNVEDENKEYHKGVYDTLSGSSQYCSQTSVPFSPVSGAANYYSASNPDAGEKEFQYIPESNGYAFVQTVYMQDNSGRVVKQSGVGETFKIGSGRETKYYYGSPEQTDLDALFGTEVGDASHYQKNMVRDANGQYSVSYVDMHGRTVATALAGTPPASLAQLASYRDSTQTESLLTRTNNVLRGRSIESSKSLLVTKAGSHTFSYSMAGDTLTLEDCQEQNICYDCLYDLTITITDDCGGTPIVLTRSNFSLFNIDTLCNAVVPIEVDTTLTLAEGSYTITKTLSVNENGMAWYRDSLFIPHNTCQDFNEILEEQMAIVSAAFSCDTSSAVRQEYLDYRRDMLLDMYPLIGQYADTTTETDPSCGRRCYSIFDQYSNGQYAYQLVSGYTDENGDPALVLNSQGNMVNPNTLSPEEFIANFQPSWAGALLPLHPEYNLLGHYEGYADSHDWDQDFLATDTYAEAKAKGYLNPTGNTTLAPATNFGSPTNSDPLSTDYSISTTFKNEIEEILFSFKTIDPGEGEVDITLWGMATAISKCTNATDGDCFLTWNENSNAFNESTLCEGELDMAWRAFRNLYQNAKKNLLIGYIRDQASSYSVVQCPCQPHFGMVEEVLDQAGFSQTQDDTTLVQNGINQFYADNCNAYALRWLQQLGSCNYIPAQADTVIKYLTEVCKRGADEVHPFGASSIHPDSTYTFDNFEEVIAYYNDQFGVTTNVNCNAYLIDKPLPYNQPGIIMNKEQWNRPDSCSCAKITGYYAGYQADSLSYESFAHYLQSYYHIEIAEGALDTLLGLCDSSISCNFLAAPVILPAALQCGTGDLCVTCPQYRVAFDQFVDAFPGITPSFEEIDTVQQRNNLVFANFMNHQFGFDKTAQEYLEYMATSCPAADTSAHCDSLLNMLQNYYYTHIRPTSGYVDLDMRTFAGNRTPLAGPKGVFNVNKQLIGRTVSGTVGQIDTSFAQIWNSDVANQVVGELSPLGSGRFRLTLNEGQGAPCHGIIGMRYYEFDNAKEAISTVLTGVNCYVDFGDGHNITTDTAKSVGSTSFVFKYKMSERPTWNFSRYQPHYQMYAKHYYADTLTYTICVYHTDTMGVFGFDNVGAEASLTRIRNLRGYMPQHTLTIGFHNTQDSTINSVDSIYNFNSVSSIELLHFDSGDQGITQFLNNNFDPFTNNDGLKEAWIGYGGGTVPSGYSVRPVNEFLPNLPVNFPDLSFIRIDDLEKHDVNGLNFSIPGLQGLHLRNSTSITAGRIDSILNQVASAAVKDSGLIYFEAIPEGAVRTSASDAAVATLTAKKWTLWGAGMDINGNLPAAATSNYAFENVFTNEFTEYFNSVRGTNYTFTQIRALYDSCGYLLDLCNIPLADSNLLCGKNKPVNIAVEPYDEDPCKDSTDFAWVRTYEKQRILYDSLRNVFEQTYLDTCLNLGNRESFTVTRPVSEYHYTLYYYDQAGNLVKTIPPEGVRPNRDPEWLAEVEEKRLLKETQVPSHFLPTVYRYNSLNQVVSQKSPDGGLSKFWYDRLGRLSVSQNAKQAPASKYSVTHYDPLGRIVLVAEKSHPVAISNTIAQNPKSLYNWIFYGTTSNAGFAYEFKEATVTVYDQVSSTYPYYVGETPFTPKAHTLRNRVSASRYYTSMGCYYNVVGSDTVWITDNVYIDNAIEYSYDIHGNVDSMLNIYNLNTLMFYHDQNRFKMITYKYDLVSGKVNEVHYNPSTNDGTTYRSNDEFYHRYIYDADNRLTDVYTTDTKELIGQSPLDEHEAHYQYYKHGPLARSVLGQQQVQGVDYAYTLQGWLKGVNSTAGTSYRDMGQDGQAGGYQLVARDAYGFNLNYYTGDYLAIGSGVEPFPGHTAYIGSAYKPLYNGNISSMAVTIGTLNQPQLYNYQYDQLNRIVGMDVYRGLNTTSNSWSAISLTTDYQERIAYDANGNILKYLRNGTTAGSRPLEMDSLNYAYNRDGSGNLTNNRLRHVKDAVSATNYLKEDIDNQGNDNYSYDEIGNLIGDTQAGVYNIKWNVYGKIKSLNRTTEIAVDTNSGSTTVEAVYHYDANGNRIGKIEGRYPGPHKATWYVRDAQGNVMAVYEKTAWGIGEGVAKLTEHHVYGSSRLGIIKRDQDIDQPKETAVNIDLLGPTYLSNFKRGDKFFELSNHLGNVLVTVSDKHSGVDTSSDGEYDYYQADVVSASDYYPFGMQMVGRVSETAKYRYGFNGQEKSDELTGSGNSYTAEFWQYDARIGRRWNVDPKPNMSVSVYATFENNPVWFSDIRGDSIDPKRTKGMNFFVLAKKDLREADIQSHGGKWSSPYWANYKRAKRMERRGKGQMTVIEANSPQEALDQIKSKLGNDGYVKNIVIDYHRSSGSFGNTTIEGPESKAMLNELAKGYAGIGTAVYLGQCWAGGNDRGMPNLTEQVSKEMDGAAVYGQKAQASSLSFYFHGHFSRYVYAKEGNYQETPEYKNVGMHVVSFFNTKLQRVSSVEIYEKIMIKNSGQIHSKYSISQLQNMPSVIPTTGTMQLIIPLPPLPTSDADVQRPSGNGN